MNNTNNVEQINDNRSLNAITRPAVEPLPHIDALLDGNRSSRFFTNLDLASSFHQLQVLAADWWKTSFRSQLGQFEWNVVPFGLQGASSLLMRHEPGADRRLRLRRWSDNDADDRCGRCRLGDGNPFWVSTPPADPRTDPWRGSRGFGPAGPVLACLYG